MNHAIERSSLGVTAAVEELLRSEREKVKATHHPLPLALVLQFYSGDGTKEHPGDKPQALALAKLIADIEVERREDVLFVFARALDTPLDEELYEAGMYVGQKMPVMHLQSKVQSGDGYPGECYELWASAVQQLTNWYYQQGIGKLENLLMMEADAAPMSKDWIDRLKRAHQETLDMGKRVTGPCMRYPNHHVNGTMIVHASLWPDRPSLHRCPPKMGWDCFHGHVMLAEANQASQIIRDEYGMAGMSDSVWMTIGREAALVTSVKDGLHQHWSRRNLVDRLSNWRNPNCKHP